MPPSPTIWLKCSNQHAQKNDILTHLDGAQIFNAAVALGVEVGEKNKKYRRSAEVSYHTAIAKVREIIDAL